MKRNVRLSEHELQEQLAELGIRFVAAGKNISGTLPFASFRDASSAGIYFLEGARRLPEGVRNSVVLVDSDYSLLDASNRYLLVDAPQQAFYRLMRKNFPPAVETGVHPTAIVDREAVVPSDCYIGPFCIVEAGVDIGTGCRLDSHVVVKSGSVLGERVQIESHCTIGATGVAWVWNTEGNERLIQPQTGGVRIGNDVFIGSDVAVVRGSVNEDTSIGDGTVIAHGSKIGHGCRVGAQCHLANNVSLAGNVDLGDRAFLGSGAVVRPQVTIADGVVVGAGSVVVDNILEPESVVYGAPAKPGNSQKKRYAGVPIQAINRSKRHEHEG